MSHVVSMLSDNHLLYISRANPSLGLADVDLIVRTSIMHNEQYGISGMLLFSGEHFAQYLEGSEGELAVLLARIRQDSRHSGLRLLFSKPTNHRLFSAWSMAYLHDLGKCDLLEELTVSPLISPERAERLIPGLFKPS